MSEFVSMQNRDIVVVGNSLIWPAFLNSAPSSNMYSSCCSARSRHRSFSTRRSCAIGAARSVRRTRAVNSPATLARGAARRRYAIKQVAASRTGFRTFRVWRNGDRQASAIPLAGLFG